LVILFVVTSSGGLFARSDARTRVNDDLEGKLGGSLASFDTQFERTDESRAADSISFSGPDQSTVFVQFTGGKIPKPADLAYFVMIRAPRPSDLPALVQSDGDWTIVDAQAIALIFLPPDADIDEFHSANEQEIEAACTSDLLAEALGASDNGACQIRLLLTGENSVSYVTVTATNGDVSASTANPCEGLASWSEATASRLQSAQSILIATSQAIQADPWAPQRLRQFSSSLELLADDQANSNPPLSVEWPSDLLTGAFNAYASAMKLVSAGLVSKDSGKITSAVDTINGANADIDHAKSLLEPPLSSCGLSAS
jgi:hypothetical protein